MPRTEREKELMEEVNILRKKLSEERDLADGIETVNIRLMQRIRAAILILDSHEKCEPYKRHEALSVARRMLEAVKLDHDLVDELPF